MTTKKDNKVFFEKNKYVYLKNILNKDMVSISSQYALFDEAQDFNADTSQVFGAHSKYADPLMESLLLYMTPILEKELGLSLYPSYSFYRVYRPGNELAPHKDRPSCEITATLSLLYDYNKSEYDWPIFVDGNKISMSPGDLVCFRGAELEHWREKFIAPEGSWHIQAFLHYVDANGPFSDYKYDKRKSIGEIQSFETKKSYIQYT
jgi:hypothetical protein